MQNLFISPQQNSKSRIAMIQVVEILNFDNYHAFKLELAEEVS